MWRGGIGGRVAARRGRLVVAFWTVLAVVAVGAAVGFGAAERTPFAGFRQAGHWVFDRTVGAAFHLDGATKNVDAKVTGFPGGAGGLVVRGGTQGFVLRGGTLDVFDIPTLTVDTSIPVGITEEPVGLETPGGPYLVYRATGTAVRLGVPPTVIQLGGPVGEPVTTDDGSLWVWRTDTGAICRIRPGSAQLGCPGTAPAGHRGDLTVIGDRPAFVDTTARTVHPVRDDGLGPGVPLGAQVGADARPANADVGGRLPVLDGATLVLADVRSTAGPITVGLPAGEYAAPVAGEHSVAVLNRTAGTVQVFDAQGHPRGSAPVPGGGARAKLARGEDRRVYLDNAAGTHTLVVDRDGSVTTVPVNGADTPAAQRADPSPPKRSTAPGRPARTPAKPGKPPVQGPPAAPATVTALPGNGSARISWAAAVADPGVSGYTVSWQEGGGATGSVAVNGNQLTTTLTGLRNGGSYVASVTARNAEGTGPATASAPFSPSSEVPGAPGAPAPSVDAADGSVALSWAAADGQGHRIVRYDITATGSDGSSLAAGQSPGTQFTATGLTAGVAYTFTVAATNDLGIVGPSSPAGAAASPFLPPGAPRNLTADATDGAVTLSWDEPELGGGDLVNYVLGSGNVEQAVEGRSARVDGLTNGTTTEYRVRAVTQPRTGGGSSVNGPSATVSATPGRPAYADVTSVRSSGDRQLTVDLALHLFDSGPATCRLILNGAQRWSGACADTITVGGLDYGTTYDVYASLVNAYGTGGAGTHGSATTNPPPPPPPSITVGKGAPHQIPACNTPPCARVTVTLQHFPANAGVRITCVAGGPTGGTGDMYAYDVRTDGNGGSSSAQCVYGYPGQSVWARANGVESNHFRW
jgi:hypothetical protein